MTFPKIKSSLVFVQMYEKVKERLLENPIFKQFVEKQIALKSKPLPKTPMGLYSHCREDHLHLLKEVIHPLVNEIIPQTTLDLDVNPIEYKHYMELSIKYLPTHEDQASLYADLVISRIHVIDDWGLKKPATRGIIRIPPQPVGQQLIGLVDASISPQDIRRACGSAFLLKKGWASKFEDTVYRCGKLYPPNILTDHGSMVTAYELKAAVEFAEMLEEENCSNEDELSLYSDCDNFIRVMMGYHPIPEDEDNGFSNYGAYVSILEKFRRHRYWFNHTYREPNSLADHIAFRCMHSKSADLSYDWKASSIYARKLFEAEVKYLVDKNPFLHSLNRYHKDVLVQPMKYAIPLHLRNIAHFIKAGFDDLGGHGHMVEYPIGSFGTEDLLAVIQSVNSFRLVRCFGGGEHRHDPIWFWLTENKPLQCPGCSQHVVLDVIRPKRHISVARARQAFGADYFKLGLPLDFPLFPNMSAWLEGEKLGIEYTGPKLDILYPRRPISLDIVRPRRPISFSLAQRALKADDIKCGIDLDYNLFLSMSAWVEGEKLGIEYTGPKAVLLRGRGDEMESFESGRGRG